MDIFKREERYIVVKIKDAQAIDSNDPFNGENALRDFLKSWHIPTREALVIESDWPEYEPAWTMIERRMTGAVHWEGQGYPPAGAICEIRNRHVGATWAQAVIHYASRNVVVWDWVGEPVINGLCTAYAHAVEIRPVRAPEQIAAEERTKAVDEMLALDNYPNGELAGGLMSRRAFCEALYDAGIRKQVAP